MFNQALQGDTMDNQDWTISKVAEFADCHRNTVKRYEERGYLKPMRDVNGYRRYSKSEARKLKELLTFRKPAEQEEAA
jgi:DNA-binding transcriptional MerR regulator